MISSAHNAHRVNYDFQCTYVLRGVNYDLTVHAQRVNYDLQCTVIMIYSAHAQVCDFMLKRLRSPVHMARGYDFRMLSAHACRLVGFPVHMLRGLDMLWFSV